MNYLLSSRCAPILSRLSKERTLCAFDFDGTLAPIVAHPDQAGMRDCTRVLLARVAAIYPCVVISGRSRADLLGKLGGLRIERVVGNHGAEAGEISGEASALVKKWKAALQRKIGGLAGILIEDKGLSLAVHYRNSPPGAGARRRILEAAGKLEGARVFGGKKVINLAPRGARHKGGALAAERARLHCSWVLFVGDDDNDEDAFALDGNIVPVRVGQKRNSHARYYLRNQCEIDTLLERLVINRTIDAKTKQLTR